jgi:hypothetical protein
MMTGKRGFAIGMLLLSVLLVISCDDFYSSTWGTAREYETAKINVNADNVDTWVENATGNPELAAAVTEKIKEELKNDNLKEKDKAKLQEAGVSLAVEASGIGETIISAASDAVSALSKGEVDALQQLLVNVHSDFKKNKGAKAAADLSEIVSGSLKPNAGKIPEFTGLYADKAQPSDVGLAVSLLTLALVENGMDEVNKDMSEVDLAKLTDYGLFVDQGKATVMGENPKPETVALAAYLNLIASDTTGKFGSNPITGSIKTAFGL